MTANRYARQQLIEWWDQERLRNARVLVAGAGALGNEVLKNLALLGVGHVLLVDFDRIEASNLSRTTLFRESDIGSSKVEVAARALADLNPEITVQTIYGDLFYDVGLGYYRHSNLAIGCLDNFAARAQVGRSCGVAGIPYLDGGMWSLGGEARWFFAGEGPCFECTLTSADQARANERRSCTGFRLEADEADQVPTVATTASIVGGLLAQEAVKWLCGHPVMAGKAIVYNGQALRMHRSELNRNPECAFDHLPYRNVIELGESVATLTPRRLLSLGRSQPESLFDPAEPIYLELGRDFLLELQCPVCGQVQEMQRLWGQVSERERTCPSCGAVRRANVLRSVDEQSACLDWPLARLGVPPGEVLAVHGSGHMLLYEVRSFADKG